MNNTEDNSIEAVVYQGKSIAQWEKDFNGEFTAEQLAKMARGSVDLQKLLYSDSLNEQDDQLLDAKEFFEEADKEINETEDKAVALNESKNDPEDVVTVKDFIYLLREKTDLDDKISFRANKKENVLLNVDSKNGYAVIDFVDGKKRFNEHVELATDELRFPDEGMMIKDIQNIGINAYPRNRYGWMTDNIVGVVDGKVVEFKDIKYIRPDYPTNGTFYLIDGKPESLKAFEQHKELILNEKENMKESYSWRRGGYGGTGRKYSDLGDRAPRGAAIGWFAVDQIDPKAKGKMYGWRMGPSNFPFTDLLYPERKYKVGTTVMRNKYVKAGSMSGEKYIAIPSYFSAIKNNDQEAINILNLLGIPLDLTFGMDPNDDYSMTYTMKQ